MTEHITQFTDFLRSVSYLHQSSLFESLLIVLFLVVLHLVIKRIVASRTKDDVIRYKWRKNVAYILTFIGFLLIGRIWFQGMTSLATFLGLLSAGLVIVFREPLSDIAGWFFILWRKPFHVGDRIEIGNHKGDVIDLRIFKFTILEIGNWVAADQSTGRVIHIPNHLALREPIANYTSDFNFIWNEIAILITFESNWQKAKKIITEIVMNHMEDYVGDAEQQIRQAKKSYLIVYENLSPIVYTEVSESGIRLTIRHLSHARKRRGLNQMIWEDVLNRFQRESDIQFAYQTLRLYQNQIEGKPGVKGSSTSE